MKLRILRISLLAALPLIAWPKWDETLFLKINGARHPALDAVSTLASGAIYAPQIFYVYGLGYGYYAKQPALKTLGTIGLSVTLADIAANQLIKSLVHRQRPKFTVEGAQGGYSEGFNEDFFPSEKYSFPSQSASLAASEVVILSRAFPKYDKYYPLLILMNGWSKIYEGAHYPLDILAGTALGAGVAYAALFAFDRVDLRIESGKFGIPLLAFRKTF